MPKRKSPAAAPVTHGVLKSPYTLRTENDAAFLALETQFQAEYQPVGPTENQLVDQMVIAAWRRQRIWGVETSSLDMQLDADATDLARLAPVVDPATRVAFSMRRLADTSALPDLLLRYETTYNRAFDRAVGRLVFLQQLRRKRTRSEASQPEPAQPTPAKLRNEPLAAVPPPTAKNDRVPKKSSETTARSPRPYVLFAAKAAQAARALFSSVEPERSV